MRKIIFIAGTAILTLCMTACKMQNRTSNNASTEVSAEKVNLTLAGNHWKLFELFGNPVNADETNNKEPYVVFEKEDNRFNGDAGCNRIVGSYQIEEPDRIIFSQVVATRMMCINMETEDKFLQVINTADTYTIENDTLTLSHAQTPLARFVAVSE